MERLRRLAWRVQRVVAKPTLSVFFLRGHPRSGTNWIGALLNLHPRVHCTGEFHLDTIRHAVRQVQDQTWHVVGREPVRSVLDSCLEDMVRRCLEATCPTPERSDLTMLGDRSPHPLPADGRSMVPGAPYILLVRDGRDVLVSWRFHLLRQPPEVARAVVPEECLARFLADAEEFRKDPHGFAAPPERLLADEGWVRYAAGRWANWVMHDERVVRRARGGELPLTIHVVRYEQLHADVESERRRMYEVLGLDPSEAAPLSAGTKTTAGFGREDARSFFRHGAVGDWKRYATDDARRWIKESAGQALVGLGYEKGTDW